MIPPSIAVTVPTWKRGEMFEQCVDSLLAQDYEGHIEVMCVVDHDETAGFRFDYRNPDSGNPEWRGDLGIARRLQAAAAVPNTWAGLRSVRIKRGPGRSNWRPGAIHFPVFEHWLQTKCQLITYQFSDEWSGPSRFREQVDAMRLEGKLWSYLPLVDVVGEREDHIQVRSYRWDVDRIPTNQLMTPSILMDRGCFENVGGLDYPLHVAAKAEEWIQTHCGLLGAPAVPVVGQGRYFFREHPQSLGHAQGPQSTTYQQAVAETGWVEDDHWRLWNRLASIYQTRVDRCRSMRV